MHHTRVLLVLLSVFTLADLFAQEGPAIVRESWSDKPVLHKLTAEQENEPAVIISDRRRIEYIDINDEQVQYRTMHKVIHVNDDRGIESFNRVYLPVVENKAIVDIRARTILPSGKIIELDQHDIKEIKEDDNVYKIFAMEGLTRGAEVEFMYTYNSNIAFFGREVLQGTYHVLNSEVEIVAPERLVFESRIFNGPGTKADTVLGGKRFLKLALTDLPGADEEKYSMYTANLRRVEYKLSYNTIRSTQERIFTWNELAKRIHQLHEQFSEKELKKVNNLVDSKGWKKLSTDKEKIIAVENFVKGNYASRDDIDTDEAENIEWILKNKISSHRGMIRLFSAIFNVIGVAHEHVLCGSRESFVIDRSFENWSNCMNSLIYIPSLQKYVAPTETDMRFPWFNPSWGGSEGIFCKPTTIGNYTSAIGYTKQIRLEPAEASQSTIDADVRLNNSLDTLIIDSKNLHTGYLSNVYRRIFNYNSEEDLKNIVKSMVKESLGTERILSTKIENKEFERSTDNTPFVFAANVLAPGMIEKAGNRVLIKVGELIGPQVQMYQEKKRLFPVELGFPHLLVRKIRLQVPAGYRIRNIDDLKINSVYKDESEVTMGFESAVQVDGNIVTINVTEQYRKLLYPIDQYEPFQKIINAAADFNKVVLVLEKM